MAWVHDHYTTLPFVYKVFIKNNLYSVTVDVIDGVYLLHRNMIFLQEGHDISEELRLAGSTKHASK
jgi:hypothetical protein